MEQKKEVNKNATPATNTNHKDAPKPGVPDQKKA